MGEETDTIEKRSPEMTPQEDGTKVLLNEDGPPPVLVEEVSILDFNI